MKHAWIMALGLFAVAPAAFAAPLIDCAGPIAQAQKAIDKVTGDLQGMDKMMPKSEMSQIRGLITQAVSYNKQAQQSCGPKRTAYDQAQAVARASSASGYANAADMLHFHYMQMPNSGSAMNGMKGMSSSGDMQKAGMNMGGMQKQ